MVTSPSVTWDYTDLVTNKGWTPVPGYEGRYEAHPRGDVRSLGVRGRTLKPVLRRGYRKVVLYRPGNKPWQVNVAVVMLITFVGPRPTGAITCHGPAGGQDDSLDNIEWGTHQKNQGIDRVRDGTRSLCGRLRSLSAEQVAAARRAHADGVSIRQVSLWFDANFETVRKAVHGLGAYAG
jgi:hypothetical protein